MKNKFFRLLLTVFFCLIVICPSDTLSGARAGLRQWIDVIIPTLLPFVILSNLFIRTGCASVLSNVVSPFLQKIFSVSEEGVFVIICGFLCGYPLGSKIAADLLKSGKITLAEAQYLLSFCNNPSPMFLISYILLGFVKDPAFLLPGILMIYLSPQIISLFERKALPGKSGTKRIHILSSASQDADMENAKETLTSQILSESIMDGFKTITHVGGYIMLFSILIRFITKLHVKTPLMQGLLLPSLELTNGVAMIGHSIHVTEWRFLFCMLHASFGGWCSVMQTQSMIAGTRLSIRSYVIKKLITAVVTSFLCLTYLMIKKFL